MLSVAASLNLRAALSYWVSQALPNLQARIVMINKTIEMPKVVKKFLEDLDIYVHPTMSEEYKVDSFSFGYALRNNIYLIPLAHEIHSDLPHKKHILLLDFENKKYTQFSTIIKRLDIPNNDKKVVQWHVSNQDNELIKKSLLEIQDITGLDLDLISEVEILKMKNDD